MDYKEAYYSLIERLKAAKADEDICDERYCCVIDGLIQEPEECEDERMRNALIRAFKSLNTIKVWNGIECTDILSWLEKQSSNPIENGYTNNKDIIKYADNYSHAIWNKLMDNFKKIKDYHIGCNDVSDIVLNAIIDTCNWLEKQGTPAKLSEEEQNRFAKGVLSSCALSFINDLEAHKKEGKMCVSNGECEDIENAFQNAMWDRLHRYYCKYIERQGIKSQGKSALEAIEEEKVDNANKIEVKPEFEVGDWVVDEDDNSINQIKRVMEEVTKGNFSYDLVGGGYFPSTKKNYHLWSLQDAKQGDILAFDDETIVIFKDLYNATTFHSYCYIEDGVFNISEDETPDWWEGKNFHPATKEQKDFLFKRMEEEGYKWDDEHKELKKIETIDTYCKEHCRGFKETGKCYADGSCDAKIKAEQKPAWSEEDERNLQNIDSVLFREISFSEDECMRLRDWLQSLKQRATWKPTVNEKSNTELEEPTPITPKILQKNEFELKPNGWLWCQDKGNEEQNYIFIQFRKDLDEVRLVEISFVGKIQATFRQIQDVHELQNLLNICRIKKEIEL